MLLAKVLSGVEIWRHLVHDVDLIATIPDLLVDITRDIESNLDINLGSDYINKLVDSSVMGIRENVIDTLIDGAIKATEGLGLEFTDAGVMTHTTMDHVGEDPPDLFLRLAAGTHHHSSGSGHKCVAGHTGGVVDKCPAFEGGPLRSRVSYVDC